MCLDEDCIPFVTDLGAGSFSGLGGMIWGVVATEEKVFFVLVLVFGRRLVFSKLQSTSSRCYCRHSAKNLTNIIQNRLRD